MAPKRHPRRMKHPFALSRGLSLSKAPCGRVHRVMLALGFDRLSPNGVGWLSPNGVGWLSPNGVGWLSPNGVGWLSPNRSGLQCSSSILVSMAPSGNPMA